MNKGMSKFFVLVLIGVFAFSIISMSFVSADYFSDFYAKISGRVVAVTASSCVDYNSCISKCSLGFWGFFCNNRCGADYPGCAEGATTVTTISPVASAPVVSAPTPGASVSVPVPSINNAANAAAAGTTAQSELVVRLPIYGPIELSEMAQKPLSPGYKYMAIAVATTPTPKSGPYSDSGEIRWAVVWVWTGSAWELRATNTQEPT